MSIETEQRICPRSWHQSPHYLYEVIPGTGIWLCPLEEDAKREQREKARIAADERALKRTKVAIALHADKPFMRGMSWADLSHEGQAPYLHMADIVLDALEA